ncbi:hypothetical protein ACFQZE_15645 [Paenibacillus sp. GCM10027627]|uniref:hypothetical protein n=1 Tax=unclassified Paenibacillus TaxID=185978 RepID=UPI00362C8549
MKKIMTLIIILFAMGSQLGCQSNGPTYRSERSDILEAIGSKNFSQKPPTDFTVTATIELSKEENADMIVYEVTVDQPKKTMNNVILSFSLDPKMLPKLNTSHVFQSTILNEEPVLLAPNSELEGSVFTRSFALDPKLIDQHMINIYKTVYIKVSYTENGERISEFIKLDAVPTIEIENYLILSLNERATS